MGGSCGGDGSWSYVSYLSESLVSSTAPQSTPHLPGLTVSLSCATKSHIASMLEPDEIISFRGSRGNAGSYFEAPKIDHGT